MWVLGSFPTGLLTLTTMQFTWLINISSLILPRIQSGWLFGNFVLSYNSYTVQFTMLKCTAEWFFSILTRSYHHYHQFQKVSITSKRNPNSRNSPLVYYLESHSQKLPIPTSPQPQEPLVNFLSLWTCRF